MVEIETVALISSSTKKLKQMIFFYLTDFNLGVSHPNNESQKDFIVKVFNDIIERMQRKIIYTIDSHAQIGKAGFCCYYIKFSKNPDIKQSINFIENNLS